MMAVQNKIQGTQLDIPSIDGTQLTDVDAALLNGEDNADLHDAGNLTGPGKVDNTLLNATITSNTSGNAATATRSVDSDDSDALGGVAASSWAKLASPIFTGDPRSVTRAPNDNDTSIATTAYVDSAVSGGGGSITLTESPGLATTSNSVSWLHTLAAEPDIVTIIIQCISAEYGYSVGDRLVISNGVASWQTQADQNENGGMIIQVDTSRVYIRRFNRLQINDKGSLDVRRQITYSKWQYYIKAMVVS
jgi:hypothetical protein